MAEKQEIESFIEKKYEKEYSLTVTKIEGEASYYLPDGSEIQASTVTASDGGEKLGIATSYTAAQAHDAAARAAGRAQLQETAARLRRELNV